MRCSQLINAFIVQVNDKIWFVLLCLVFFYTANALKEKSYVLGENFTLWQYSWQFYHTQLFHLEES